jgi:ribosomal protein S5
VVVVAGGRVVGLAVDVVVGEGDAVAGFGAEDVVLAADASGLSIRFSLLYFQVVYV